MDELQSHDQENAVQTINCDILEKEYYMRKAPIELAICMGDTLAHLPSMQAVSSFFDIVYNLLSTDGKLILSFRDYTDEMNGVDRFIPVHQEKNKIMSVFLEYEPGYVKVHDLIYEQNNNHWELQKSAYKKIRTTEKNVIHLLEKKKFTVNKTAHKKKWCTLWV